MTSDFWEYIYHKGTLNYKGLLKAIPSSFGLKKMEHILLHSTDQMVSKELQLQNKVYNYNEHFLLIFKWMCMNKVPNIKYINVISKCFYFSLLSQNIDSY